MGQNERFIDPRYKLYLLSLIEEKGPLAEFQIPTELLPFFAHLRYLGLVERETKFLRAKSPFGGTYYREWVQWAITPKGKRLLDMSEADALESIKRMQEE